MLMFDSLNRHMLSPYGCEWVHTPNFDRLAQHTVVFDKCYVSSMPCMPARRELHTGRLNFLHHYWNEGGAHYLSQHDSFRFVRGQKGDAWMGYAGDPGMPEHTGNLSRMEVFNRSFMQEPEAYPGPRTFTKRLQFLSDNHDQDNWLLTIETFDPHEPWYVPGEFKALYDDDYDGPLFEWPLYDHYEECEAAGDHLRKPNASLVSQCDALVQRTGEYPTVHLGSTIGLQGQNE